MPLRERRSSRFRGGNTRERKQVQQRRRAEHDRHATPMEPAGIRTGATIAASRPATPEPATLTRALLRQRRVLSRLQDTRAKAAYPQALVLTSRAVEKHINSVFSKLPLQEEADVDRRVKAVLLFLAERA